MALLCLFELSCHTNKSKTNNVDYVTKTSGKVDFGKTVLSAYTPEIRVNMKKLYEDKFGLFVHFGPYAQLEGKWKGKEVTGKQIAVKRSNHGEAEFNLSTPGIFIIKSGNKQMKYINN